MWSKFQWMYAALDKELIMDWQKCRELADATTAVTAER